MIRVIFFGTEQFAVRMLQTLAADKKRYEIVGVVTQPPRPVGRKQIMTASPVAEFAATQNFHILTPTSLKGEEIIGELAKIQADLFIVAQYGLIIPKKVLDIPPRGAVNVHASLLPSHRGASPVHATILAGDTVAGITFMMMDEQMDHGDIISMYSLPVLPSDTTPALMDKLATLASEHLCDDVVALLDGKILPQGQLHDQATFTKMLSRETGYVAWNDMDAETVERMVRALYPWPGVTTEINEQLYKIIAGHVEDPTSQSESPGKLHVTAPRVWIETKRGNLVIDKIQPSGKDALTADQFSRGYSTLDEAQCVTPTIKNASQK